MFESLTDKLSRSLRNLRGVGKLSEENVGDALAEVRKALLSADVHFRTAREFVEEVKRACMGQEVLKSVSPKICIGFPSSKFLIQIPKKVCLASLILILGP